MDQLRSWIGKWENEIKLTIKVIIAVAVVIFGGLNIIHAIKDFGGKKMKEGLKSLGYAGLIIFIGIIGYAGLMGLVNMIAPDSSVIPRG